MLVEGRQRGQRGYRGIAYSLEGRGKMGWLSNLRFRVVHTQMFCFVVSLLGLVMPNVIYFLRAERPVRNLT